MAATENKDTATGSSENLIDEIIRMSDFSFERMPMLEIIGERMASTLSEVMSELSGSTCETKLSQIDYVAMWQALENMPEPGFFAVCGEKDLDGQFLLAMNAPLVLTTMELMLGGKPSSSEAVPTRRPTAIERRFSSRIAEVVLSELQTSFGIAVEVEFELNSTKIEIEAPVVTQPANLCVRMQFSLVQAGQVGDLQVVIPYEMLEPIRPKLNRVHFGERNDESSHTWQIALTEQIERANVELEAELTQITLPLHEIMNWRTGDRINLWIDENHGATVIFNGRRTFTAELGKRQSGNTAIKITQEITTEQEIGNE